MAGNDGDAKRILVIGYGNKLRGDDGIGPHLARVVGGWNRPGVEVIIVQQLTPELAAPLAGAQRVIFLDARLDKPEQAVEVRPLAPSPTGDFLGHAADPGSLLSLVLALHGQVPEAWAITVAGQNFAWEERLSPTALDNVSRALEPIRKLLD